MAYPDEIQRLFDDFQKCQGQTEIASALSSMNFTNHRHIDGHQPHFISILRPIQDDCFGQLIWNPMEADLVAEEFCFENLH